MSTDDPKLPKPKPDVDDAEATQFVPRADTDDADATQFVPQTSPPDTTGSAPPDTWFGAAPQAAAAAQTIVGQGKVQIGAVINNNYKITEVLSAGGMGEVYRGENVFTNDPVAIKVILDKLVEDEKASALFLREAKTLSQLTDDAIVRYRDFVRDPGINRFCLIMEFIEGVPLSDHIAQYGPVPMIATHTLMARLAKGLDKAHQSGVIHRDLSPDNVMLPAGMISEARLIDFGIAQTITGEGRPLAEEFAGKFKYVAPEQLGHHGGVISPRTDIYGLGLLISAAVRGEPLAMGQSIEEASQLRRTIPDLSDIPNDLRPLIKHMLEPDPADRPANMADVIRFLDEPYDIPDVYFDGPKPKRKVDPVAAISTLQTVPGLALPPTQVQAETKSEPTLDDDDVSRSGGRALKLMVAGAVVIAGALGVVSLNSGMFTDPDPAPIDPVEPAIALEDRLTPRQPNSRDGFLAGLDTGPCTYVARVTTGLNAGILAGYGTADAFSSVTPAYEAQFGGAPAVRFGAITAEQCPVLDFARTLQGRAVPSAALAIEGEMVASGQAITGQFTDLQDRNTWLALVSPLGRVYPITEWLEPPVQGTRRFAIPLQLADGTAAAPQVFLAVVSDQPLVSTAQIREGVEADVVLPLILEEIAETGGQGTAAIGQVMLVPAPPPQDPPVEVEDETEL